MVKNSDGLVAIRHWNSNPSQYTTTKYNVSLGWVKEGDLPLILAIKTNVCCGQTKPKFTLANELDVRIFNTGSQHPEGA